MIKKLLQLICGVVLLGSQVFPPASQAESNENGIDAPLSKLFVKYSDYLAFDEEKRSGFYPRYKLTAKEAASQDVVITFEYKGKEQRIDIDEEGYLLFSPTKQMLEDDPLVHIDQPQGTLRLNLQLGVRLDPALSYETPELHEHVHKAFKAAKSLGGFMAVFAPSHSNIKVGFDPACENPEATYEYDGRETNLAQPTKNQAIIPFKKDKKMRKRGTLKFSCVPVIAELS